MSDAKLNELWDAVWKNDPEACEALLAAGALSRRAPWRFWKKSAQVVKGENAGRNPFHLAACFGFREICERFVEAGVDIHERNVSERQTALHYAAKYGHPDLCRWLLELGASAEARMSNGETPLYYAKDADVVQVLLDGGANPHAKDRYKRSPYKFHLQMGRESACRALAERGFDQAD